MVFISDSSGRFGTSYMPQCVVNEHLKQTVGISDNYNYRMHLQRNADKIMEFNKMNFMGIEPQKCDCKRCMLISKKNYFNKRQ